MDEDTVRVELPDPPELRIIEVGLADAVSPDGADVVESVTVPAKPLRLLSLIWAVPDAPLKTVRDVGLDEIVKSTTLIVTRTECESDPIVPVTVTV